MKMASQWKNIPMKIGFNGVVYDEKNGILTDDNANANKKNALSIFK